MGRKRISDITPEECLIEQAMREFSKLLRKAKQAAEAANRAEQVVFRALDDMCIDLDAPSNAENADNIADAITCYLAYNEYSHEEIVKEVRELYSVQTEA